ncbi:hypothetical protein QQX10_08275 [Demequina sp. SYSU T00039]|uniref:DNA modification methylase n=1 Tax=Demequina lignilytica TaxID=3051663 RepID=A0AAW7M8U1_9MICO|nr:MULTISPECIES: hypothetical protein [unclassified Demequina]MDN4477489.1 hypothetical protein [Demequina sp. SYSU T00039-1]MDN4488160.1 hypothetical protein [Demequina sp. SYSU T00039]MDN4490601.1 hypothetical protein [Demequina sp. SYSU T00068]
MKIPAGIAAAAVVSAVLAGCSAVNPITTQMQYDASDGISLEIGDVTAYNLLVLTPGEGETGVLIGTLENAGTEDVAVSASIDGTAITTVDVPAGATVKLGGDDGETAVTGTVPVLPGLLTEVVFQTDAEGQVAEDVPVLDGTLPEYDHELSKIS